MSENNTLSLELEPQETLADYRQSRADAGTSVYRESNALTPAQSPAERQERQQVKVSARRAELQKAQQEIQNQLAQIERRPGAVSAQPAQPSAVEPAQTEVQEHERETEATPEHEQVTEQPTEKQTAHDPRYDLLMERAAKAANPEAVVQSMYRPAFPQTPEGVGRYLHLGNCLQSIPNGNDVLFHLSESPDVMAKLQTATPQEMQAEVFLLSARLLNPEKFGTAKPRPVSSAPEPIRPVSGGSRSDADFSEEGSSLSDYRASRERQARR